MTFYYFKAIQILPRSFWLTDDLALLLSYFFMYLYAYSSIYSFIYLPIQLFFHILSFRHRIFLLFFLLSHRFGFGALFDSPDVPPDKPASLSPPFMQTQNWLDKEAESVDLHFSRSYWCFSLIFLFSPVIKQLFIISAFLIVFFFFFFVSSRHWEATATSPVNKLPVVSSVPRKFAALIHFLLSSSL